MPNSIAWLQVGDLHMDERTGFESKDRLEAIVEDINEHLVGQVDFLFLPGDNANHATPQQYAAIVEGLAKLRIPWRVIPGDHDFEPGNLKSYEAAFPAPNRPDVEVFAGHRCVFLDVVSAGGGGPDFRLTAHQRHRLARELTRAEAEGQTPLVFMHAYPGDLAADIDEIATMLADAGVAFVSTGHTHYNELLNDGRVIYGATRSLSEIEEDGGRPGFSLICVHEGVPSWRFRRVNSDWPAVQIVSPGDFRMVTRPACERQVPRPGKIPFVVRSFGQAATVSLEVDGEETVAATQEAPGLWKADLFIADPGIRRIVARCDRAEDAIDLLVRPSSALPKRGLPVAPGRACHAIGPWPQAGIEGTQLGPNRNGRDW